MDEQEQPRRSFTIIRKPYTPEHFDSLGSGFIAGIDDPAEGSEPSNFTPNYESQHERIYYAWEPQDAEQLDRMIYELAIAREAAAARAADAAAEAKRKDAAINKLLMYYGRFIQAEVPVMVGKTSRRYKGVYTQALGQYTHQPERVPELIVEDKDKAQQAGLMKERVSLALDTTAARKLSSDALEQAGVRAIPQAPVSFSASKGK